MRQLLLLALLGVLTWYYFPETRAMLVDAADPVVLPVLQWSAREEMDQVARNVVEHKRLTGEMPEGPAWLVWLEYRYATSDLRTDPWRSVYQLEVSRDSVWIVSLGPDRTRLTDDDFRVAAPVR